MRLNRLEVFGFKSFADRTVFDFGSNSLTGIVGPNGCGKSNVVDALRWVLGEQRPTSMRGTEMADVIFKGSSSRPSMSVAEATIVLDNGDGTVEERGAEIAVTRRVFKSGEGEYLIDGERVRLKDVREMLFDTGLGSRGYSVLEQGRIDAVLSANPQERRRIFEEAAGISRYRQRRAETESRLRRVERDMTRLDDLLGELRTRVRSLKIQAGKAERWVAARAEWSSEKTRLFKHQLHHLDRGLAAVSGRLAGLDEAARELRAARERLEHEVATREEERVGLSAEVERLAGEASRLAGEGRALDERRAQLSQRVASWRDSAGEESARAEKLAAALAERTAEIERSSAEREALALALEAARTGAGERSRALHELDRSYQALRRRVGEQNETVLGHLHERTESANTVRHLEESRVPTAERHRRALERLARAEEAAHEVRAEEERASGALEETRAGAERLAAERVELAAGCERRATALAELEGEERRAEVEHGGLTARIDALLDRESELADLDEGARRVLAAAEAGEGPCAPDALAGLVADWLRTDTRYARALDAVLGQRARALVVVAPEVACDVLAWLKERREGQVALALPRGLAADGNRALAVTCVERETVRAALAATPGLVALREHVRCAPEAAALADALCGDVVVAPDLAAALAAVGRHPGLRFVTPEGDVVDAAGVVGGHREVTQGPVGRRSSAADLRVAAEELAARIAEFAARAETERAELAASRATLAERDAALARVRQELAAAEGALRQTRARLADHEAQRGTLATERDTTAVELERLERDLDAARARRVAAEEGLERENAALQALEVERRELETRRDRLAREEGQAQVEVTRLSEQLEALSRRLADLDRVRAENQGEASRAERLSVEHAASAERGEAERERLGVESAALQEKRGALEERLGELRERLGEGARATELVRRKAEETTRDLETTGERLAAERLEEQRLTLAGEEVVRRAQEDLELSVDDLAEGFEPEPELRDPEALAALERRVKELKGQLDKLGPVNMDAFTELEETGGRLEFLEGQYTDLEQARRALADTLRTIDAESKKLFVETFEEVRANFQRIFRQLFGGGKADVTLADDADVLEAGVDIFARPPGREMLSIGLLSGGQRTMTALALLFAVFEARPSPFCVLDEVDAALDDANIERFLGMLAEFRRLSQFVIVTHNKGTMAACETLFGVTMQVKGVSRYVAVELDEVDAFVPEATGKAAAAAGPERTAVRAAIEPEESDDVEGDEGREPVVELVPARVDAKGRVQGGSATRLAAAESVGEGDADVDGDGEPDPAERRAARSRR